VAKTIVETFCPECKKKMEVEINLPTQKGMVPGLLQYGRYCEPCLKIYPDEGER